MSNPGWENSEPLFENEEIEEMLQKFLEEEDDLLSCECGSEACGSPMHSSYCPKFERE